MLFGKKISFDFNGTLFLCYLMLAIAVVFSLDNLVFRVIGVVLLVLISSNVYDLIVMSTKNWNHKKLNHPFIKGLIVIFSIASYAFIDVNL
ncbi:hypothetical protein V1498_09705 [Peribacillus sp. SCS-26]|uniref:hypothetical protein n=1 Tax=Paraperibacillus marinus TaxID=3115295 RepID=UPI003906CDF9